MIVGILIGTWVTCNFAFSIYIEKYCFLENFGQVWVCLRDIKLLDFLTTFVSSSSCLAGASMLISLISLDKYMLQKQLPGQKVECSLYLIISLDDVQLTNIS